jgi:uncharacterized protein YjbI with pentapeptide repeats
MASKDFMAALTEDELIKCEQTHPEFRGNKEHLARLYRVLETPRSSNERRDVLAQWGSFNTTRTDSMIDEQYRMVVKTSYSEEYRGINLRGLRLQGQIVGPIDLRGADLRDISFSTITLPKADFTGADLRGADLQGCWLRGATLANTRIQGTNFTGTFLGDANFRGAEADERTSFKDADLQGANLSKASLRGTALVGANLQLAQILETDLTAADLSGCQVFGIAAWSPSINTETRQENLLVTPMEPTVKVNRGRRQNIVEVSERVPPLRTDSLEHAHLVHLMLNPDLSHLLASVTNKGVLLLGRFSGEHGQVLDALRVALRGQGYLPLKFDFRRPEDRTLKETVLTLAGLCRFIIADLTEASSIPLELATIVKDYKIPVVPIQRIGRRTFSMFESIEQEFRDRVLPPLEYEEIDDLLKVLVKAIIDPALNLAADLVHSKSIIASIRKTRDYLSPSQID